MSLDPPVATADADRVLQHPAVLGLRQFAFYSAILCDPAGRIIWVNSAFEAMTGYAEREVLGLFPGQLLQGPATDPGVSAEMETCILERRPFRGDVLNFHKSGRPIWVRIEITPVHDADGAFVAFFAVCADVSDLKEAEARLRARDAVFRSAFLMSRIGGWRAEAETGRVSFMPETDGFAFYGHPDMDFETAMAPYAPEDQARVRAAYEAAFRSGEAVSYLARMIRGEESMWVQVTAEPEVRDGGVVALNGVIQDVSNLRAAERMLEEKDRYAMGLMDVLEARVGVVNAEGEIIHANRVWRERLQALEAAQGESFTWNYREQCARIKDHYGRELEAGITALLEGRSQRFSTVFCSELSAPPQWFKFDAIALEDAGDARVVVLQHNITELKEAEAKLEAANAVLEVARRDAEAANQAKSKFLANLSHEIRTPLNGVVAIADMLSRAPLAPAEHDMVETIRTSGGALSRLLADMLDLARIESGRVELEPAPFRLADAVRAVAALSDLAAREKGVDLQVRLECDAEAWVLGDVNRIKQVLTNLINNAVKFTPKGEVRVTVRAADAAAYRIDVADTGVGFSSSDRNRLFDRFEQADSSVIREYGGSGLGLAIVRELVDLMGGLLDCVSEPGVGSTFSVILPLPAAIPPIAGGVAGPGAAPFGRRLGAAALSVLVADDHPINRRVIELILKDFNVTLTAVEDGAAALDAVRGRPDGFDVVLMDMQMPVMDGLTATRALRAFEQAEGRSRAPVIMVSANAMPTHLAESLEAGADLHLSKPLTAASLVDAVETVLERQAAAG